MVIDYRIKKNQFQDALRLMRISANLREMKGVTKAVAVMATDKAKFALENAGLMTPEIKKAVGSDLVMVVEAENEKVVKDAIEKIQDLVSSDILQQGNASPSDLLNQEIRVINLGLEIFKESLEAQGVRVIHVGWQVPAMGNLQLINILKKMY